MLSALILRIAESFWAPRRAARRLLERAPTFQEGVLMALAGVTLKLALVLALEILFGETVQEAYVALVPAPDGAPETAPEVDLVSRAAVQIALTLAGFAAIVALAASIGRRFGGVGSPIRLAAVVGWWSLVDAAADTAQSLMILSAPSAMAAPVMVAVMALNLYLFYMLAAFLAEAHGFAAVFPVMVAMFIVSIGLGMIVLAILSAAGLTIAPG